ncbi:hypothetical protein V5O48_016956 [Marasmius crinis-equi]|uniref:Uncharacterized protein n=1 Tax=Marasmius crinis-equi TaxID=585013 RepID=A0ABR3EQJ3_9AGAR
MANGSIPMWKPSLAVERAEQQNLWYPHRAAELSILQTGEETGVGAVVVSLQIPLIFGSESGLSNQAGVMIPVMMGFVLEKGHLWVCCGRWNWCAWEGVCGGFGRSLCPCRRGYREQWGEECPFGKEGHCLLWGRKAVYQAAGPRLFGYGVVAGLLPLPSGLRDKEIRSIDIGEAATTMAGDETVAELVYAGHALTKEVVAKERLGWEPTRLEEAWRKDLVDEMHFVLEGKRGVAIDNCLTVKETKRSGDNHIEV